MESKPNSLPRLAESSKLFPFQRLPPLAGRMAK